MLLRAAPGISTKDPDAPAEARVRRRKLDRFPFAVISAESETAYVVIAVQHLAREPGYWLQRLEERVRER